MGWSIGYDNRYHRDIGYGVPAYCDHPGCNQVIDRGISYVCGGEIYGGDHGCGLHFCEEHLDLGEDQRCERCASSEDPFDPGPDHPRWIGHKLSHESWEGWRMDHPDEVRALTDTLEAIPKSAVPKPVI